MTAFCGARVIFYVLCTAARAASVNFLQVLLPVTAVHKTFLPFVSSVEMEQFFKRNAYGGVVFVCVHQVGHHVPPFLCYRVNV